MSDGKLNQCKPCEYSRQLAWNKANPDKVALSEHKTKLKALCGITPELRQAAWNSQGGLCAICTTPLRRGTGGAATDHNHKTRKFRALLCSPCNASLGLMQESPDRLRAAAAYLELHASAH